MDVKMRNKKGQITIFIIIAVLLVAVIALFFVIAGKSPIDVIKPSMPNPQENIEKCVKDSTLEAVAIMMPQAGYISPENYKLYNNNKVQYLCYTNKFYYPCINQEPMYIQHLEEEIKNYIKPKIETCFYNLKRTYQERNYVVEVGAGDININLVQKQIEVDVNKGLKISKNEETRNYEKFKVKIISPLYDLAIVAQEITNQEAKFCYFEYLGFSLLYPTISIDKKQVGSEETVSKIYSIRDKISGKELLIAIRSCAMPGGL